MYKYLLILICSIFAVGCDQPVAENTDNNPARDSLTVFTTAKDTGQRIAKTGTYQFKPRIQPTEGEVSIFVNSSKQFQKFLGIGGSFTDASAEVFAKLDNAKQEEFLKAYFDDEEGIGYSLARTTIHSSDFGSASHTYIEEGDKSLETFLLKKTSSSVFL